MVDPLSPLFHPASVAIVGISRSRPSLGQMILDNIVSSDYNGPVYLVNPKATEIAGRPVHNNIEDIDGPVDLAVLLTPPRFTPQILRELVDKQCKYAIIISAGFSEELNLQLREQVPSIRIIGPNSMGIFSSTLNGSFSPLPITKGTLGYLSQSGSIIAVAQEYMTNHALGFSAFASLGNKLDLTEMQMFSYLASDTETTIIGAYLESFSNPTELRMTLTDISREKPVILVKGGRTDEGSKAVSSHTGALAGNFRLTKTLLKHSGVVIADTIEEQITLARFIDMYGIDTHHGVVTVSSAGGPGVLAADEIIEYGLNLASLKSDTITQLDKIIPPFGNSANPIDLVADAGIDRYVDTIKILQHDPAVSTIVVIIVHPVLIDTKPLLDALNELEVDIPIICAYLGPEFAEFDVYDNLLVFQTTKEIAQMLVKINTYYDWQQSVHSRSYDHLLTVDYDLNGSVHNLLQSYGYTYPDTLITTDFVKAQTWFTDQNSVVLKLDHPQFSHKTDVGGVLLDIDSEDEFNQAWHELQQIYDNANIPEEERNIELQPFYSDGIELVLGIIKDDQFGHFILIGAGGTLVEMLDDTIFVPAPTCRSVVKEAIRQLKINQLLEGYRGSKAVDLDALVDEVLRLDKIIYNHPEIEELDINPLFIMPDTGKFVVLDARMDVQN